MKNKKDFFYKFLKPNKWTQEEFSIYMILIFILVLIISSILNIIFYQLGFNVTNQLAFGKTISGKYGTVTESGLSKNNPLYIISWFVLIFSVIASIFWFISNIYLIKFSKKFVFYNQIALFLLLFIDIVYGAWWIVITDLGEITFVQYSYFAWDKREKNKEDPYLSNLNYKSILLVIFISIFFILFAIILITPIIFSKEQLFYDLSITSPDPNNYDNLHIISEDLNTYGYAFSYSQETGIIYDIDPLWDTLFAIMQISGVIFLARKNWFAWVFFEISTTAQFIIYLDAGNLILLIESVLLFISNLFLLCYWFMMNRKAKENNK
ncbi:hypothetical protein [Candidatus Hepatoplasma crinochetorum]|uniref:Nicotinamide mononucleotide transporter PnuC n=1 Tax=Candidatus Hepatoplasma crinochetorum Av TaxID=1427984 RepID=W8GK80_9MOLU|nr:hypothetical protein [Candidatus Hepatoplasma crinochetorum]AHK22657.1 hypothetical protein X271_00557 [Candidatus Hepatoplasma crinochetorum Av]BDV03230.1 MAG: hypothetical protein HCTKY_5240 [Candidatus Hepatoplasma crinochetorum]